MKRTRMLLTDDERDAVRDMRWKKSLKRQAERNRLKPTPTPPPQCEDCMKLKRQRPDLEWLRVKPAHKDGLCKTCWHRACGEHCGYAGATTGHCMLRPKENGRCHHHQGL